MTASCAHLRGRHPPVRDAARADAAGARPRRAVPPRHRGRRAPGDAAPRLAGERRPELVRRLRCPDRGRLPRARDRPPRPRPRVAAAGPVPSRRLRRRRRRGAPPARTGPRADRRLLDGRRDRAADRARPSRRRLRDRAQRHRPALAGAGAQADVEGDGGVRRRPVGRPAPVPALGPQADGHAGQRADGVGPVGADAPLRAGRRRGRTRARAVRLAPVAGQCQAADRGPDHDQGRGGSAAASSASWPRRPAARCWKRRSATSRSSPAAPTYNPVLLQALEAVRADEPAREIAVP